MTLSIRVLHNTTLWNNDEGTPKLERLMGEYVAGDELTHVADIEIPNANLIASNGDTLILLEEVYRILNIGEDPAFGPVNEQAVEYRRRKNRSLSVGDVMVIDGIAFTVAQLGFDMVDVKPEQITNRTTFGTTPLEPA